MKELIEQRIKELEQVILTVNSIPYPSREEKRLKGLCQRELEELNEEKSSLNQFQAISMSK